MTFLAKPPVTNSKNVNASKNSQYITVKSVFKHTEYRVQENTFDMKIPQMTILAAYSTHAVINIFNLYKQLYIIFYDQIVKWHALQLIIRVYSAIFHRS